MAKGSKPITAIGFKGMNNLPEAAGKLLDNERQITPQVVLNADVTDGGTIQQRGGFTLSTALTNVHSLAGAERGLSVMLCVADGVTYPQSLYLVDGETATELGEVTGPPGVPVNCAEINNRVYIGNPYWQAIYDLLAGTMTSWGVPLPAAPSIALVDGDLPPGTYTLCYTNTADGRLGGNGPLVQVKWVGGTQGIQLNNLPAGALAWITQPDGKSLFLAPVSGGVVTGQSPFLQPLPTFMVQPPPGFTHFAYAFGRIWGVRGKQLFYSDPSQYEWFRPQNYLPFLEDLVMVAPVNSGLYVNSLTSTWFLDTAEPGKMVMTRLGKGAVPGTLTYAQLPASLAGGAATLSDLCLALEGADSGLDVTDRLRGRDARPRQPDAHHREPSEVGDQGAGG